MREVIRRHVELTADQIKLSMSGEPVWNDSLLEMTPALTQGR